LVRLAGANQQAIQVMGQAFLDAMSGRAAESK
jgi:hypothetical protein